MCKHAWISRETWTWDLSCASSTRTWKRLGGNAHSSIQCASRRTPRVPGMSLALGDSGDRGGPAHILVMDRQWLERYTRSNEGA